MGACLEILAVPQAGTLLQKEKFQFHEAENTKFGNSQTGDLHSAKPEAATESPARF